MKGRLSMRVKACQVFFSVGCAIALLSSDGTQACTIFVLTDTNRVLFCNNEDWKDRETRIWFIPGGKHFWSERARYGGAFVGFDNGWGQGGLNTEGLAFDWVAGYREKWERDPKLKAVKGNPAQRMLETCATVEEAIRFFQTHWEPSFSYGKILISDRSGASASIIGKEGRLHIERLQQSRGFGYGQRVLETMLAEGPEPTLANAGKILNAARQEGTYATKYANVFDLKTGDIFLFQSPGQPEPVKLNLHEELKKGGHYYKIPSLQEELSKKPKPLTRGMKKW